MYFCTVRMSSYGQHNRYWLDQIGAAISSRRVTKACKSSSGRMLDIGAGYDGLLTQKLWTRFDKVFLADLKLNVSQLKKVENLVLIEGVLPESIKKISDINVVIANNIIEHLDDPKSLLDEVRNLLADEYLVYINVPSWFGKMFLEFAAFKLEIAPSEEMDDHKNYYDKKSLWTLVRNSGFLPSQIKVKYTKLGMNTTCWVTNAK